MIHCLMAGDSIAVGVGQFRPECETIAQVGINSDRYIAEMLPTGRTAVDTAVISLGVNDDATLDTLDNLRQVRSRISGRMVYWLLPGLKDRVRAMIRTVAEENGDRVIDTRPQAGRDHLHPTGAGYQLIAARTQDESGMEHDAASDDAVRQPRHLRALATPAERIRRLRAMRQADGAPVRRAHATGPHAIAVKAQLVHPVRVTARTPMDRPASAHAARHAALPCADPAHPCARRTGAQGL